MNVEHISSTISVRERWFLASTTFLSAAFAFVARLLGTELQVFAVFVLIPGLLLVLFSFQTLVFLLLASLFIHPQYLEIAAGAYCSVFLLISFAVTQRNITSRDFWTPMTWPFLIYCLSTVPSVINAADPLVILVKLHNLLAFAIVLHLIPAAISKKADITKFLHFYLFLVLLNSIHVIIQALLTSRRAFGFAGIMFVDYVGTGIIIAAILFITSQGMAKFRYGTLTGVFSIALVLTQTRGVWLVTVLTLFLLIVFLIWKGQYFGISRKPLIAFALSLGIFFVAVVVGSGRLNPDVAKRTQEVVGDAHPAVSEEGYASSSLVTRVLVWSTAYNAFIAHPIVGIGLYTFPVSSHLYNTLPPILFNRYVKGLTPHVGYLAVLTETGIVGLLGFIFFIRAGLRRVFRPLSFFQGGSDVQYSLILAWVFVYITISLFTTDAWLWGQGIVLMGIIIGFVCANEKLVKGMG